MDPLNAASEPTIIAQVVNIDDLVSVLSAGTPMVASEQRAEQIAERQAGYADRFHTIATD